MRRIKVIKYAKGMCLVFGAAWLLYLSTQLAIGIANTRFILASASQTPSECHGITLPPSATILSHEVSPSPVILDGGATTRLTLSQTDFQQFLAQLQINSRAIPCP